MNHIKKTLLQFHEELQEIEEYIKYTYLIEYFYSNDEEGNKILKDKKIARALMAFNQVQTSKQSLSMLIALQS